jgi:Na+:H+ antiporter, NhaA family
MKGKTLRFPLFIVNSLLVLPLGCVVALVWANTLPESYYGFSDALAFWVNEVGIVFFFGLMAKEVREATLPGGDLHPWRRAWLPIAGAIGGVFVPVGIYVLFLNQVGEPMLVQAWVVTCAVDVAACYLIGGFIFGKHPAAPFLLLLALASNAIGLSVIALLNPTATLPVLAGLAIVALAMTSAIVMRRNGVSSFWPYLLVSGTLCWFGLRLSGIHTALALVPIVPLMPHTDRDEGFFIEPGAHCHDALSCFERFWVPPVQAVLFLVGLVNGGVPLHGLEVGMWSVPLAVIIGRPLGVLAGVELAVLAGLHRVPRVGWRELIVLSSAASIGLTFALFFTTTVLATGPLLEQTKTGSLLTAGGAIAALVAAWSLGVGRFGKAAHEASARL